MKIVFIVAISILIFIVLIATAIYLLRLWMKKPDVDFVLSYIKNNSSTTAITLIHDGQMLAGVNQDRPMPLASTVKIIIAIEYAKQAGSGQLNPDEKVNLMHLNRYYIANTDGNAHPNWLRDVERRQIVIDGQISLEEVAKGMISYSSNANTEYLIEKLGLNNINRNLEELGLTHHEPLYPFVASLLIPYELMQNYPSLSTKDAVLQVKDDIALLSIEHYRELASTIHSKLEQDANNAYKQTANIKQWYDKHFDKLNSVRFIAGSTADYVSILEKLNSKQYYDSAIQLHLDRVMEGIMLSPTTQSWLKHAGRKGGSTASVLTQALYATDKEGHTTELALFFAQLDPLNNTRLTASLNAFNIKLLQDTQFRLNVHLELKSNM